jgi:hypothetical protein
VRGRWRAIIRNHMTHRGSSAFTISLPPDIKGGLEAAGRYFFGGLRRPYQSK